MSTCRHDIDHAHCIVIVFAMLARKHCRRDLAMRVHACLVQLIMVVAVLSMLVVGIWVAQAVAVVGHPHWWWWWWWSTANGGDGHIIDKIIVVITLVVGVATVVIHGSWATA